MVGGERESEGGEVEGWVSMDRVFISLSFLVSALATVIGDLVIGIEMLKTGEGFEGLSDERLGEEVGGQGFEGVCDDKLSEERALDSGEAKSSLMVPRWLPEYLENNNLLRRLDLSSAPCLAPSVPSFMLASFLLTSRWMSPRSTVGWWEERREDSD